MRTDFLRRGPPRRIATAVLAASCLAVPAQVARAAAACPSPPPVVRDLALDRYYADKAGTEIDPALKAAHADATRPLAAFLRTVADAADRAVARRDPAAAACAAAWLESWARGGALLGTMSGAQAQSQRKWDLAGLALAYVKIKPALPPRPRETIEPWLTRLADAVHADAIGRDIKRNNHWYWLGVGMAATALATGEARYWAVARNIMSDAARAIALDGTLALELARGPRALHYHAFSVMALVTLAELGSAGGEDWYALGDGALHRLVRVTAEGLSDPARFDRLTGVAQERPVNPGAGWLGLYGDRFADRRHSLPAALPSVAAKHRWLGGDVGVLSTRLRALALARR